jgi:hypothetical protein
MDDRKALEKKLARINARIDEAEARLGAHSIKPILMQQLFELEEERAVILEQIDRLKNACPECPS